MNAREGRASEPAFCYLYTRYDKRQRESSDTAIAGKADVTKTREDRIKESGTENARQAYVAEHPVVRTHPETGRKSIYVNFGHTAHFAGMTEDESEPLLDFLFAHQIRPEFTCRFSWRVGSIAFWDNRCVLHNPINDYHGYKRLLHRVTLKGDKPR